MNVPNKTKGRSKVPWVNGKLDFFTWVKVMEEEEVHFPRWEFQEKDVNLPNKTSVKGEK